MGAAAAVATPAAAVAAVTAAGGPAAAPTAAAWNAPAGSAGAAGCDSWPRAAARSACAGGHCLTCFLKPEAKRADPMQLLSHPLQNLRPWAPAISIPQIVRMDISHLMMLCWQ